VRVRGLETLCQFRVDSLGFSALDMNNRFQAAFNLVGKGQQRKRHHKPRHR
jgi:hypothetical protein